MIPVNVKTSLLNKYAQVNAMKDHGKAEHNDYLIKDILEEMVEDLKKLYETPSRPQIPLAPIIQKFKSYDDGQSAPPADLDALIEQLQSLRDHYAGPETPLKSIIKELEEWERESRG